MGLRVTHREQDGISILQLKGRLTLGPEDELLNDEIQHALTVRRVRVVIDLSGLNKMEDERTKRVPRAWPPCCPQRIGKPTQNQ